MKELLTELRAMGREAQRDRERQAKALALQLPVLEEAKHDGRRVVAAGRLLDRIARERLYRATGHRSFGAWLTEHAGLSRTTAHRWRALARAADRGEVAEDESAVALAYEKVRRGAGGGRAIDRAARRALKRTARELVRRGVEGAHVELVSRGREPRLVLSIPVRSIDALLDPA